MALLGVRSGKFLAHHLWAFRTPNQARFVTQFYGIWQLRLLRDVHIQENCDSF